ncbi:MAG: transposase [Methanolinea sp.]|nr:transposase [Methanolinea sp.]
MNGDFGRRRKRKCGRGAAGKIYVFSILERGKKVNVEVVADIRGDTFLELVIYKVKRGSLIHIDKFRSYNGLVPLGSKNGESIMGKKFANGKECINEIEGGWAFAKERLLKYHGVDAESFLLPQRIGVPVYPS